jgi:hypothetical protein
MRVGVDGGGMFTDLVALDEESLHTVNPRDQARDRLWSRFLKQSSWGVKWGESGLTPKSLME